MPDSIIIHSHANSTLEESIIKDKVSTTHQSPNNLNNGNGNVVSRDNINSININTNININSNSNRVQRKDPSCRPSKTSDIEIYEDVDPNLAKIFHQNVNYSNQIFVVDQTAKYVDTKDTQTQNNYTQNQNNDNQVSNHRNHYVMHPIHTGKLIHSIFRAETKLAKILRQWGSEKSGIPKF